MDSTGTSPPPRRLPRGATLLAACVVPLAGAALVWWAADAWLLAPARPSATSAAEAYVQFISHERGLPRLDARGVRELLDQQADRLLLDGAFRRDYVTALRRAPGEQQTAFRRHLARALKPLLMDDVRRYHALGEAERTAFLDEQILKYNRLAAAFRADQIDRSAFGAALPDRDELLRLLLSQTNELEREQGTAFIFAYLARVREIERDPERRAEMERQVAGRGG